MGHVGDEGAAVLGGLLQLGDPALHRLGHAVHVLGQVRQFVRAGKADALGVAAGGDAPRRPGQHVQRAQQAPHHHQQRAGGGKAARGAEGQGGGRLPAQQALHLRHVKDAEQPVGRLLQRQGCVQRQIQPSPSRKVRE